MKSPSEPKLTKHHRDYIPPPHPGISAFTQNFIAFYGRDYVRQKGLFS